MVETDRIKAFQSDYYRGGQDAMARLIGTLGPNAAVFYLSDIGGVPSNKDIPIQLNPRESPVFKELEIRGIPAVVIENTIGSGNYPRFRIIKERQYM